MSTLVEPKKTKVEPFNWQMLSAKEMWIPDKDGIRALDAPTIIDGMLREGEVVSLIGGAKTYKTWIAIAMANAVASGTSFIGKEANKACVCYLDYELKLNCFRKRLSIVASSQPDNFNFQCIRKEYIRLPTIRDLKDLIIMGNYKLLIIDSLYRTGWLSEENSNDNTSKELGALQGIAEETGAAIVIVDHTAKGGGKDKSVQDAARGASAKAGFFDSLFLLRPNEKAPEGNPQVIVDMVLRDWPSPKSSPIIGLDFSNYQLDLEVVGESSKGDKNGNKQKILEMLSERKEAGVSYRELDGEFEVSESNARRIMTKLISEGLVEEFNKPDEHKQRKFFRLIERGF